MLATSRLITPDEFRSHFATHPLIGHLARRLVWVLQADAAGEAPRQIAFRVDDGGRCVEADGTAVSVDPVAGARSVGVAHPLRLDADSLARWRRCFERLGLRQPFPQLDREVFRLSSAETASVRLHRI